MHTQFIKDYFRSIQTPYPSPSQAFAKSMQRTVAAFDFDGISVNPLPEDKCRSLAQSYMYLQIFSFSYTQSILEENLLNTLQSKSFEVSSHNFHNFNTNLANAIFEYARINMLLREGTDSDRYPLVLSLAKTYFFINEAVKIVSPPKQITELSHLANALVSFWKTQRFFIPQPKLANSSTS